MKQSNKKSKKSETQSDSLVELENAIKDMSQRVDGFLYPLIIPSGSSIDEDVLFDIYSDLLKVGKQKKMHILLYSYGGYANTAFNLGRLLQSYSEYLSIVILREAKSAATLLACAADQIILTEISELGPMDPQIRSSDSSERFSPLAIKHIFDLLEKENKENHTHVVESLTKKLPNPLILGEHLKSLEAGKDYLVKLLEARMLKNSSHEEILKVANQLVTGYPSHGYCIDLAEARSIGLNAERNVPEDDQNLLFIMRAFKSVWSEFEQKIISKDQEEAAKAFDIYVRLRKLASNVAESQKIQQKQTGKKKTTSKQKITPSAPADSA